MKRWTWRHAILPITAATALALDQSTKRLVAERLALNESWNPIPALMPFVRITHVTNTGAAFGLLPNQGNLFILIAIVVVAAIVFYHRRLPDGYLLVRLALGLQLGGALGNLLDRLRLGYVVDFIDFRVWPVFNLADSSIVLGVVLLAYTMLREEEVQAKEDEAAEAPPRSPDSGTPLSPLALSEGPPAGDDGRRRDTVAG